MKKLFLTVFVFVGISVTAQVKIGNNPTTIGANSLLELESTNKGVLFPRVALTGTANVAPLAAHVAGMTIYNTATAGDVTPGLYTNNGTAWVRVTNDASVGNIYSADGTIAANRTVAQTDKTLAFTSNATTGTSHFTVDGTTLNVDANLNRVGVGTAAPKFDLHVQNSGSTSGIASGIGTGLLVTVLFHNIVDGISSPSGFSLKA